MGREKSSVRIRRFAKNDFGPAILKNYPDVIGWDSGLTIGVVMQRA